MSFLFHLYPAYQSVACLSNPDRPNIDHWLTFWICSYLLEQLPLPGWLLYPAIATMYLPNTTEAIRESVLYKGYAIANEKGPEIASKVYKYADKYIPKRTSGEPRKWWDFQQFWRPADRRE